MSFRWVEAREVPANGEPGSMIPAYWELVCDRPGCGDVIPGKGAAGPAQRRALVLEAESKGWDLCRASDVPLDFCPLHGDPAKRPIPITRLYDDAGNPLSANKGKRQT